MKTGRLKGEPYTAEQIRARNIKKGKRGASIRTVNRSMKELANSIWESILPPALLAIHKENNNE